jgi:hypothetical protein
MNGGGGAGEGRRIIFCVQAKIAGLHRLYEEKAKLVRSSWELVQESGAAAGS